MELEQANEWLFLEKDAINLMSQGPHDARKGIVQVLVFPAFDNSHRSDIIEQLRPSRTSDYIGIRTEWRKDKDLEKFRTPVERLKYPRILTPTLETRSVQLDTKFVEGILGRLRTLSIPVWIDKPRGIGLDGIFFELRLGSSGFLNANYRWWVEPPEEWQPLAEVVQSVLQRFDEREHS